MMEAVPGLRPWEIDAFTLTEISMILEDPESRTGGSRTLDMTGKRWRDLTAKEKLEFGRRLYG